MSTVKDFTLDQLRELSRKGHEELDEIRKRLKMVNKEIAEREHLELKARHLDGLSDDALKAIIAKRQAVKDAGGVKTAEKVDKTS